MGEKTEVKDTPPPTKNAAPNKTLFHYFTPKVSPKPVSQGDETKEENLEVERSKKLSKKRKKTQRENDSEEEIEALKCTKKNKKKQVKC